MHQGLALQHRRADLPPCLASISWPCCVGAKRLPSGWIPQLAVLPRVVLSLSTTGLSITRHTPPSPPSALLPPLRCLANSIFHPPPPLDLPPASLPTPTNTVEDVHLPKQDFQREPSFWFNFYFILYFKKILPLYR